MLDIIVVLHNVRSLHNVGSIFRTADAAGIKKIYLCGITPSPLDRFGKLREQFKKVSLGAENSVQWEKSLSTTQLIVRLKKQDYKILAVEQAKRATPYYKINRSYVKNFKTCLVLGNEIKGIPTSILKKADKILEIPMRGEKESLNVAVAFGIVAYSLMLPVL
ncbi:MAG: TrmH family RNA methyltransferase [Patescibacteria group bacterium]